MNDRRRFLRVIAGGVVAAGVGCDGSAGTTGSTTHGTSSATTGASGTGGMGGAGGAGGGLPCTMTPPGMNVGAPTNFAANGLHIVTNKGVLIGRDAGGLWALTAICPHQCCDMSAVDAQGPFGAICKNQSYCTASEAGDVICLCHGSVFKPSGLVARGPANTPLDALALALGCDGNLYVDMKQVVPSSVRLMV